METDVQDPDFTIGEKTLLYLKTSDSDWHYKGIEIYGYDKNGRDVLENQDKFD